MNALQMLLAVVALCLVTLHLDGDAFAYRPPGTAKAPISAVRITAAILCPLTISAHGVKKGSLSASGAVAAFAVGGAVTLGGYGFMAALLAFFLTASKATKFKSKEKQSLEENFKEGGQRNWVQVLCNGGVPAALAAVCCWHYGPQELPLKPAAAADASNGSAGAAWRLAAAIVGAIAAAAGDTFSSELGPVLSSAEPRLITTMRKVPRGTNGGVTLAGTVSSGLGGAIVGLVYGMLLAVVGDSSSRSLAGLHCAHAVALAAACGLLGSTVDSVIGALFQYSGYDERKHCIVERSGGRHTKHIAGWQLLDNHSVNVVTCIGSALVAPWLSSCIWSLMI